MGVRLIAGRAGSGKTYWCLSRICEALAEGLADGPRLIMLVPEQAALQMERGLLARLQDAAGRSEAREADRQEKADPATRPGAIAASARCEILSFRRLAHRILNETSGPMPVVMSPTGRQMALRLLILRHRQELQEFNRVAERGTLVSAVARGIAELLQEAVTVEQLQAAAQTAADEGDPSAPRLHDTALLYGVYLEYLGSQRVDPEGVLDLARARLAPASWLDGARVWTDGFAGLTQQQGRMIVALARRAAHVDIALLIDPDRERSQTADAAPDDFSLFARTERTWFALAMALREAGVTVEEPVFLGRDGCPRFHNAPLLSRIEQGLFTSPLARESRSPLTGSATAEAVKGLASTPAVPLVRESCSSLTASATAEAVKGLAPTDTGIPSRVSAATPSNPTPTGSQASPAVGRSGLVRLVVAPDRRAEVAAAVRTLVDLVQRPNAPLRYRDIAVIVRDLTPYHDLLSASLRAHGIPFFIDRRRPTHHHPLVQMVRGVLAMHAEGPFDQAITAVLKSGLSGLDEAATDALENYLLAHGLVSPETWSEPWKYRVTPGDEDRPVSPIASQRLAAINASRETLISRFGEWWPGTGAKFGHPACRTWVERLYRLIERLGVPARLAAWCDAATAAGELDEAEEHGQVWSDLVKLLDELVETLGDEQMTGRQCREVIESGLAEFTLGLVPATLDQVLVGSIERSRHPPVRAAFVLGFEDGLFPARPKEETIFGDQERVRLAACGVKLGRTSAQQLLDERMLAYIAFSRPSEFLWVSHPASDEQGRATSPSPYWPALRAVLPELPVEKIDADGLEEISTSGELAGSLAARLRAWCEKDVDRGRSAVSTPPQAPEERQLTTGDASPRSAMPDSPEPRRDDTPWLALYDWARSDPAAAAANITSAVRAALSALALPSEAALSPAATERLWPPPYRTSVTRLEQFAWCPFQHFVASGLKLLPRAIHELAPVQIGALYHTILEQFVNELMESGRRLRDLSTDEIADNLSRLSSLAIPAYAEQVRLEDRDKQRVAWRSGKELPPALTGEQEAIGRTPLRPVATERVFGGSEADDLPALELHTPGGRTVLLRGKIDRVDLVPAEDAALAVVLDYKRSIGRRLRLDEAYHGLALQLLAYLLVLRDHGERLAGTKVIPGGAFYLPLLGEFEKVDHPAEADQEDFTAYGCYKPRGIVDFDAIDRLDPELTTGRSSAFSVHRTKEGDLGNIDSTDAVHANGMQLMLDHVSRRMGELADQWLSGDIAVKPVRLGRTLPCPRCPYRSVCRFEYTLKQMRGLPTMSRSRVLEELGGGTEERIRDEG